MPAKLSAEKRLKIIKKALAGENISRLCKEAGISRTLLYRWIRRYKAKAAEKKEKILNPQDRLSMIERVKLGEDVARVCKLYKVSRTSFYKWKERYDQALEGSKLEALWDKKPEISSYYNQAPEDVEGAVLSAVREYPELSSHKIVWVLPQVGGRPVLGNHGVQNVLRRHSLSTYEQRLLFSQASKRPTFASRFFGAAQAALAAVSAQEIGRRKIIVRGSFIFVITLFLATASYGGAALFKLLLASPSLAFSIGMIFSLIALGFGMFFFLYSLKYYITIAMVLSYSRKLGDDKSLITAPGLRPDLSKVTLDRKPFVSIHLATYNEKKVLDRLLTAATSQEYENYEVVLVDDSTDEDVLEILKRWQNHPRVRIIHRDNREGYKGGALRVASEKMSPKAEFIIVFDADFIPYPDTITQFLKYFKLSAGTLELGDRGKGIGERGNHLTLHPSPSSNIAVIQGYQWHVLNKSENWITRGVRSEFSGSYVVERSGEEIYSGLKQIAGAVYMIRADLIKRFGWGTSITEDFQLTLKLYEAGYKVVYTPYIQAPAEAVSTLKRLIRQRMRWAEGHSYNIRRMLIPMLFGRWENSNSSGTLSLSESFRKNRSFTPSPLTLSEKFELLYLAPYYLQSFFFIVGTFSWFLAEVVFKASLPFWTATWGWSLVLTNFFALPLMNLVGLFLEDSDEKDYLGLASFVISSYIVAPFQGYAAVKGFLEKEEGPWFRTPKTGKITDVFTPGRFYNFIFGWFGRSSAKAAGGKTYPSYQQIQRIGQEGVEFQEEWTGDSGQGTADRGQRITRAKLAALKLLLVIFRKLRMTQIIRGLEDQIVRLADTLAHRVIPSHSEFALRSAFSNFRTLNPPKRRHSRWNGKIILAVFLGLTIFVNNLAFMSSFDIEVKGLNNISIKPKLASQGDALQGFGQGAPMAPDPGLEQQINIIDQAYTTQASSYVPTNSNTNSLGLVRYTAGSYTPTPTAYFEAVIKNSNSQTTTAALFDSNGAIVSGSEVSANGKTYTRVRSAPITLVNATDYTARVKSSLDQGTQSSATASIIAARIILVQNDPSNVTKTETQIEVGNNETTSSDELTTLSAPKYFQYDNSKYDGTPTAYFEATLKGGSVTPTTSTSAKTAGTSSGTNWTTPGNTTTSNNAYAIYANTTQDYLILTNFGFTSTDIPSTATVTGITVTREGNGASGTASRRQYKIVMTKDGSASVGTEKTAQDLPLTTDDTVAVGSSSDLWGTTWTSADLTSTTFGVKIADNDTGSHQLNFDLIQVTVAYTESSVTTATAELYNRTDGLPVTESSINTSNATWTRARSAALSTNWDTTNADEYEVRVKTSNAGAAASIANAKIILTQNAAGGITKSELYHNYLNAPQTQNTASVGTFNTTTQGQLLRIFDEELALNATIGSSSYVYVIGGNDGVRRSTIYKATLNSTTGDLGAFSTTSQAQMSAISDTHGGFQANINSGSYIYVLGGQDAAFLSTVYKATLNSTSGNIDTFATTSQTQLPVLRGQPAVIGATIGSGNYIYVLGGETTASGRHSTVYKSTIDASQNVGAFATTTQAQLPAIRAEHAGASATVGPSTYIYILGGTDGTIRSTVYKAAIDSSGDINVSGGFLTTSQGQLPQVLRGPTVNIMGIGSSTYVYVVGGCPAASCTAAATASTVYKATLNSTSGDINTFSTTSQTQLPLTYRQHAATTLSVGSSTYLYVLGGESGTRRSTVYKSTLSNEYDSFGYNNLYDSNNYIGGTFTFYYEGTLRQTQGGVTANARMVPGQLGGITSTQLVNSPTGDVGTFATTSQAQLIQALRRHQSAAATIGPSSYIYVLGGCNTTNCTGANIQSTVYKSTINTSRDALTFGTTSQGQLPATRYFFQASTATPGASTYIYVLGGTDGTNRSTVYQSVINSSNGNIVSFATTSQGQFLQGLSEHAGVSATVGASTYLYVLGGHNGTAYQSTVYKSPLAPLTGNAGAFATTSQAQLIGILGSHNTATAFIGSSTYLYVLGGCIDTCTANLSTVYKSTLNSTTGDAGTFATTSQAQLPQTLREMATVVSSINSSTYIYVIGSYTGAAGLSTVYKSTLNSTTGDAGTFATTSQGQLPQILGQLTAVGSNTGPSSYIYVMGGSTNGSSAVSTVYKGAIQINPYERVRSGDITSYLSGSLAGNAGTFATTSQGQLPATRSFLSSEIATLGSSTYIYVLGGDSGGASTSTVFKAPINNGAKDAGVFSTSGQAQIPVIIEALTSKTQTIGSSTYIYVMGGWNVNTTWYSTVYKSTLNSTSGDAGAFATTSQGQLPAELIWPSSNTATIGASTYLYVAGGSSPAANPASTLYKATINGTTGDIGTFDTTSQAQLPANRNRHTGQTASVGPSTYLYVIGGCSTGDCSTGAVSTVYKSTLNSTTGDAGTLATTSQAQLPVKNDRHTSILTTLGSSTYLYVMGGTQLATSTVYRATLNGTTGDIGAFDTTSQAQLPEKAKENTSVLFKNGASTYMYVMGGCNADACGWLSTIYKTTLVEDLTPGNVGTFSSLGQGQLPAARAGLASVLGRDNGNNFIYQIGGGSNSTVYKADIGASGNAGTFATTNQVQLLQNLTNTQVVSASYGGTTYIWVLGGDNTAIRSTVYRANSNGVDGTLNANGFSTTSQAQLPTGLQNHVALIGGTGLNGNGDKYVYILGGCNATGSCATNTTQSTVYRANIKVAADAQTFATTSQGQILTLMSQHTSIVQTIGATTYIYIFGSATPASTVYRSTLNSTTGDVGTFATTTQGQLPQVLQAHTTVASTLGSSTYIYVLGGNTTPVSTVYKSTLNSTTGDVGTFATTSQGQLLQTIQGHQTVTATAGASTYIYVLGGCNAGTCGTISTVYKSTINSTTGDAGTFATTGQIQLPQTLQNFTANTASIGSGAYVYIIGGCNAGTCGRVSTVYKSTLNSTTGNVETFATTTQGQLPQALNRHSSLLTTVGASTYLYVIGGSTGSSVSTVYRSTINGTTGDVGTFDTTTQAQLAVLDRDHTVNTSTIGSSTYLYVLGGTTGTTLSTVYKSALDTSPNIQAFDTTSQAQILKPLRNLSANFSTIGGTNYIYAIGGTDGTTGSSTVYRSTIDSSMNAGAFATTSQTQLSTLLQSNGSLVYAPSGKTGFLYVVGGCTVAGACSLADTVQTISRASIDSSADVGAFSYSANGLPIILNAHTVTSAALGSTTYMFVSGGNLGTTAQSTFYRSVISNSEFDTQLNNTQVASSWLVVNVSSLQIPENLLGLLPLGLLLPKLIEKFRRWRRKE